MKQLSVVRYLFAAMLLFLVACGGGSTVTAVSLSADPAQVDVGGRSTITAKSEASVTGNTLGEQVNFSIRSNETGAELHVVNDRLDGNGEAKANYRAGTRQGVDIVEASFGSGARATVTITVGGGVVVGGISLERYGSAPAYTIRAVVRDTRGALVPGVTVNFSTSKGSLSSTSGTTNTNGFVETILTLPAQESATVYAHAGGQSASIYISSQQAVGTLSLTQNGNQIWAYVRDPAGRGIAGILVDFGISVGTITASATTDANGIAVATVSDVSGEATVRAVAMGLSASRVFTFP